MNNFSNPLSSSIFRNYKREKREGRKKVAAKDFAEEATAPPKFPCPVVKFPKIRTARIELCAAFFVDAGDLTICCA
jgi:hypothetical protein